ncbi:MAG: peptide chain release factor N(5)-glutamine methyltransferase [Patescibacteria group bacterium]
MIIRQALQTAEQKFKATKKLSPRLDAEVLLGFILKKDKAFLYTYPQNTLTSAQLKKLNRLIAQRLKNWPIAYLVGRKEFYKLPFKVNPQVLIPRPETELMIDEILKLDKKLTVADIGTGSGCIAVALAKNGFNKVYATDNSSAILSIARQNARLNKVRINFFKGNLFSPLNNKKIDIIAANLPYLSKKIYGQSVKLFPEIKKEPRSALLAPAAGLYFYRQLLDQLSKSKYNPRYVFFEIDPAQSHQIEHLIRSNLTSGSIQIKKDLCGKNRLVIVKL